MRTIPANYPNHGGGLFFVGVAGNASKRLRLRARPRRQHVCVPSASPAVKSRSGSVRTTAKTTTCGVTATTRAATRRRSSTRNAGAFQINRVYSAPATLSNSNNEGITFAPNAECTFSQTVVFWSADDQLNGHAAAAVRSRPPSLVFWRSSPVEMVGAAQAGQPVTGPAPNYSVRKTPSAVHNQTSCALRPSTCVT